MCLPPRKYRLSGGTQLGPSVTDYSKRVAGNSTAAVTWLWSRTLGPVHCWVLPSCLSQSRLGGRNRTSSACTFIALMVAKYLFHSSHRLTPANVANRTETLNMMDWLLHILANSIMEGNELHSHGMKNRRRRGLEDDKAKTGLFTVPQAIMEVGGIHEIDWKHVKGVRTNLATYIRAALESETTANFSQVFLVLIVVERAVCITYDRDEKTVVLIDGHAHQSDGAIILLSAAEHLDFFCQVALNRLFPDLTPFNDKFEISCVQIVDDRLPNGVLPHAKPRRAPSKLVAAKIFPLQKKMEFDTSMTLTDDLSLVNSTYSTLGDTE